MGETEINCSKNGYENGCCRSFEEDIYWTNFKSIRFFLFLQSDSFSQLMIPKKFSENMRNKIPQMAVLKSPGGVEWEVKLIWDNDTLFFGDGWKEFAKAHNFKEKDLLMFKYSRDSCFKVWVFNERDSCEKASSFFVKKSVLCKHDAGGNSNLKRKKSGENSELEGSDAEEASEGALRRNTRRQSVCGLRTSGADAKTPSKPCTPKSSYFIRKSVLGKHDAGENSNSRRKITGENPELEDSDIEEASARASRKKTRRQSMCGSRKSGADAKPPSKPCTPNREPPNEADKKRALHMASRHLTEESFMVVMKTSNVSQYYRLGIPAQWARAYLARENQNMELHANDKKWTVRYNIQHHCGGGVLVSGWYDFVVGNSLQESDVCLFKLVSQKDEPAVIDVLIWHAAPTVADQPSHKPSGVQC